MPRRASQPKLQRWTDLLAALLRRSFPADFDTLRAEVGAYAAHEGSGANGALMRMFERDKDELRALGVPIESVTDVDGNLSRYRLASREFYLPFLQLAYEPERESPPAAVRRPRGPGYQSLQVLAFEPDELEVIARAAHRVASLGDPALAHEAMNALRKLAHDLPLPVEGDGTGAARVVAAPAPDAAVLDAVGDALHRRKALRFTYRSMHRDETLERAVDPWGLAFLSGHWYLVGRDHAVDALRQFRMNRVSDVAVNATKAQTADFDIPTTFDLAAHVQSRQAWELGDAEVREVLVRFTATTGVTQAAMQLGEAVDGTLRRFRVRRPDTFARWILGFAGDARVEQPLELAAQVRELARASLGRYAVPA